jgi:hypothetical protein
LPIATRTDAIALPLESQKFFHKKLATRRAREPPPLIDAMPIGIHGPVFVSR